MARPTDTPEKSGGIMIELVFREDTTGEWTVNLVQALNEIIQTDPHRGINSIHLRLPAVPEPASKPWWRDGISQLNGSRLGRGANRRICRGFWITFGWFTFRPLRDRATSFEPSQFWGAILRDLRISEEQASELAVECRN